MGEPIINPNYLTVAETATRMGVNPAYVRQLVYKGKLKGTKPVPGLILIEADSIEQYERERKPGGMPRGPRSKKKSGKRG